MAFFPSVPTHCSFSRQSCPSFLPPTPHSFSVSGSGVGSVVADCSKLSGGISGGISVDATPRSVGVGMGISSETARAGLHIVDGKGFTGFSGEVGAKIGKVTASTGMSAIDTTYFKVQNAKVKVSLTDGIATLTARGEYSSIPGGHRISTVSASTPAPTVNIQPVGGSSGFVGVRFDL